RYSGLSLMSFAYISPPALFAIALALCSGISEIECRINALVMYLGVVNPHTISTAMILPAHSALSSGVPFSRATAGAESAAMIAAVAKSFFMVLFLQGSGLIGWVTCYHSAGDRCPARPWRSSAMHLHQPWH